MDDRRTLADLAGALGVPAPEGAGAVALSGVSTDTRALAPGQVFFALSGENFDGNRFVPAAFAAGAAAAVCSVPSEGGPCLTVASPLAALQQYASWHRGRARARVFALTGSCGKTTTKELIAGLLETRLRVTRTRGNLNNDIGCPLSLLEIGPDTDFAVIEMGANHPGEIAQLCRIARPEEAAVTLVAPAHLEGFGTIENVARAKAEIMEELPPDGVFYVNADDPHCTAMGDRHRGPKVVYGRRGDVRLLSAAFDASGELVLEVDPVGRLVLPLRVRAYATNVLLAVAVALRHGVTDIETPLRAACARLGRFQELQMGPLTVLSDVYNANPASMAAALEALRDHPGGGARIAVLGEMRELGKASAALHQELGAAAAARGADRVLALGEHAADIVDGARAAGIPLAETFADHAAAAAAVFGAAAPGDVVLVKGSRGIRMELFTEALKRLYGVE
ncbi:MAG: UDP-N-acetylmuramoyl-tripeptide--D-alanyl-D-alanine ligase [Candidatus Hydrogenedentes bacterium]|nr:UDP-N-acetylmuramoyl-tripeptide--D-alanyl-D-alanine ligase [Candidatus Hydrogenedentota bacterium]